MKRRLLTVALILSCAVVATGHRSAAEELDDGVPTWSISLYAPGNSPDASGNSPDAPGNSPAEPPSVAPTYTIGLYSNLVEVPLLAGMTWEQAKEQLSNLQLSPAKINPLALDSDKVKRQMVNAGELVAEGTEIRLDLVATVPSVIGLTLAEAYDVLEADHRFPIRYNEDWGSDYRVGVQNPSAGSELRRGQDVALIVQSKVPKVTGMKVSEAKEILTEAKLLAEIRSYFEEGDRVLTQSKRAGAMITAHEKVRLTVGVQMPNLVGESGGAADALLQSVRLPAVPLVATVATTNPVMHGQTRVNRQSIRAGEFVSRDASPRVEIIRYAYSTPRVVGGGGQQTGGVNGTGGGMFGGLNGGGTGGGMFGGQGGGQGGQGGGMGGGAGGFGFGGDYGGEEGY